LFEGLAHLCVPLQANNFAHSGPHKL
jgi:hypothetical protein